MNKHQQLWIVRLALTGTVLMLLLNIAIALNNYHLAELKLSDFYFHQTDNFDVYNPLNQKLRISVAGTYQEGEEKARGRGKVYYKHQQIRYEQ